MNSNLFLIATISAAVFSLIFINTTTRFSSSSSPPNAADAIETEFIPIEGGFGPESYAFDPVGGGPYTGISDGRIIKWHQQEHKWINFAITTPNRTDCEGTEKNQEEREEKCGRPLGLCFNEGNGNLYIADSYMGLLNVGPQGGLANKVELLFHHHSFTFTNSLDIDQLSGIVYFTDSSSHYQRRNYVNAILSGDKTGRLMKYDPESKQVNILLENLSFPNGVSLSKDGDFLLLSETTKCRILKYWLKTAKAGTYQVFAELPGFPDNIKASRRGGYWVGIHSRKQGLLKVILSYPWIGKALVKLPLDIMRIYSWLGKWIGSGGLGMRLSDEGEVMEIFEGYKGGFKWRSISEIEEREDGVLWIGSINTPFAAKLKL